MNRVVAIAAALLYLVSLAQSAEPARPNIVFVLVDDLRWDDLGCAGHPFSKSSNIDRVAREGARFRNAFATTPLCSPSRGCILTGQYAHRHGITDNTDRSPQSHKLKTFPQELQKAGYATAFLGKWHMGNDNTPRPGFDRWYCLKGQGSTFDPVSNDDGHDVQEHGYVTDILHNKALEFIRRPRTQPFLLYLSHKALHPETQQGPDGQLSDPAASNFIPAPRHEKLYQAAKVPRRPNAGVPPADKPALLQNIPGLPPLGAETGSSDTVILNRLRMLAAVDESLGEIIRTLDEIGQLDNTLIVVTGDHGYFYGEHGLSVERRLAYEESIRIPLLMRYPRLIAGDSTPEQIALTIDFAPTFLELAGVPIPREYQGRSLVPLLNGKKPADWRREFLIEYYTDTVFPRVHKMGYRAVRNDRWKYIHFLEQTDADELYDLQTDPYELKNLIRDAASADALSAMQAELRRLLE